MRWAALAVLLVAGCVKAPPCPPLAEPTTCCDACWEVDAGCGRVACAPDSGINCGPCPVWGGP